MQLADDLELPGVKAVKTKAPPQRILELQAEGYGVSPSTPLLSTHITENSYVCGSNEHGQLGVPGAPQLSEPKLIQGAGRWAALSFGRTHAAGLTGDGKLYTWGRSTHGQLGQGEQDDCIDVPSKVETTAELEFRSVACGDEHIVVCTASEVYCAGSNRCGQTGLGDRARDAPALTFTLVPTLSNWMVVQVVCGRRHTVVMTAQSQVFAWGDNSKGQLGMGDTKDRPLPTLVDALWALPVVQLAAGASHSLALTANGYMYMWGSNESGQLGLLPDADRAPSVTSSPVKPPRGARVPGEPGYGAPPGPSRAQPAGRSSAGAAGAQHSSTSAYGRPGVGPERRASSVNTGRAKQNFLMQMLEMGIPRPQAELALEETGNVGVEVATEWLFLVPSHVLAQHLEERATMLAANPREPSVGTMMTRDLEVPLALEPRRVPLTDVRFVAAGRAHTVAVTDAGVYAWGANECGQLGHGDTDSRSLPSQIDALSEHGTFPRVSCGDAHTLFLSATGSVYGCGDCESGQLTQRGLHMCGAVAGMSPGGRVPDARAEAAADAAYDAAAAADDALGDVLGGQPAHATRSGSLHVSLDLSKRDPRHSGDTGGAAAPCAALSGLRLDVPRTPRAGDAVTAGRMLIPLPVRLALPFGVASGSGGGKAPVVHEVVAGPAVTAFITRAPDELPDSAHGTVQLLSKLRSAIERVAATRKTLRSARGKGAASEQRPVQTPDAKQVMAQLFKSVSSGVEAVFSSPAAVSAAFGLPSGVGLNVVLLDSVQQAILDLYTDEAGADNKPLQGAAGTLADLHRFSVCQTMFHAANTLLEDLSAHARLLGSPERAQVLLAAFQHPLLQDHTFAKLLVPRLGTLFINAPGSTRQLLVKWWSGNPGELLKERVVKPLQSYLTIELMATKKLTVGVMNAIKVLAKVEEANQIYRRLQPDAFYNQLISDKMDVQDHYTAWRQTHDMPAAKRLTTDGPFSFCSYPFLLDPRAKSNLLHIEARFQMEQTVANARMEAQLHGGASRHAEEDRALVIVKQPPKPNQSPSPSNRAASSSVPSTSRSRGASRSASKIGASGSSSSTGGIRGLLMGLFKRSRDDVSDALNAAPMQTDSFSLPTPLDCNMPGTHSDMCILRVRRTRLIDDALSEISRQYRRDLFKPLRVHFIGEEGIDAGGVKKEFFQLLVAQLLSPAFGMLVFQAESNTYWFNGASLEGEEQYLLLGLVLGLAVYNRVLLDFPLPNVLYKKLLGQPCLLRDLEDMQPTLGKSLRALLEWEGPPGSVEDTFCLSFAHEVEYFGERHTVELIPGGEDIPVTDDNRMEYVEAMVDYFLHRSIAPSFAAFAKGFRILCDGPAIRLFNAQELERMVCGNPNLDFDALQNNAKYEGGYHTGTPVVAWLWDIVKQELCLEEKKKFLKFFTGSDRAPIGGLGTLRCIIQRNGTDSTKLPTSHTCFNTLLLPEYASRAKLLLLLRVAVTCCTGFGLE